MSLGSSYYCPECGAELFDHGHTHAGDYVTQYLCCHKCTACFDYDSRRKDPWKPRHPLYEKPKRGEVPVKRREFKVYFPEQTVVVEAYYEDEAEGYARERARCELNES
jgi:hypothetical protein